MNCPRCADENIATPKTRRYDEIDLRWHECLVCGKRWVSEARILEVSVFDHNSLKEFAVSLKEYKEKYLDYDLRRDDKNQMTLDFGN